MLDTRPRLAVTGWKIIILRFLIALERQAKLFQPATKFRTRLSHVWRIEDRRHNADTSRAGGPHFVNCLKINPTDGEPRHTHVRRRPADVFERDRPCARFRARRKNRADGDIICARVNCFLRLCRCVR